ncbi:hypothetical protein NC653_027665 [Populus alba x Populus x berolinensis]|uniref:Uncharacterized protein n=1 Tax=Populus alba x Populus x berolinensis TaxID=444605 RepID=A0AAD6M645_9ROSI|nr:hypothetical protein NC653_027665 [Populus alba x Populus x berolinensis]
MPLNSELPLEIGFASNCNNYVISRLVVMPAIYFNLNLHLNAGLYGVLPTWPSHWSFKTVKGQSDAVDKLMY